VKVSFSRNAGRGTWRAHGRYLSREGAQRTGERGVGFDAERDDVRLPERLEIWQRAGDARVWKIVVSPEAGARADLQGHTRRLLAQMEVDLGTRLAWAAIDHHDTVHPHVHVVIRGVDDEGQTLLLSRDYVHSGLRARSQELLTRELGHRHERDQHLARAQYGSSTGSI
jgi:type IV secretory pathway VirD2 relaxase